MKLNLGLLIVFITLITTVYFYVEKSGDREYRHNRVNHYLMDMEFSHRWVIKIEKGELRKQENSFFWNEKKLDGSEKKLINFLNRIGDLKIIRSLEAKYWKKSQGVKLSWKLGQKARIWEIGFFNPLTGRFMVKELASGQVFLIEDKASLQQLYKSFEQAQKIKYDQMMNYINYLEWQ